MAIITLTTDFGLHDEYVGVMKGVILSGSPEARIVDLTHGIRAQDVQGASYIIKASYPYFPEGTIHVIVVDPGVGSRRKIIAVQAHNQTFLAPDNGVLSLILPGAEKIFEVTSEGLFLPRLSSTFHGRDIFAPVAAHLACGYSPDQLGPRLQKKELQNLELPEIEIYQGKIRGSVVYIDHFGNLMTNIDRQTVSSFCNDKLDLLTIKIRDIVIKGLSPFYKTDQGSLPISLFDSRDYLEIAIPLGNAARDLGISLNESVSLEIGQTS